MSFDLTYKHQCVVHSHRVQGSSNTLTIDNTYLSHIKRLLNDSTEKSKTIPNFGPIFIMFLNITSIADIVGYMT